MRLPKKQIATILKRHGITTAYLFGSHARGTPGPLSDIDIAVLAKEGVDYDSIEPSLFHDLALTLKTDQIDLVNIAAASPLLAQRAVLLGQPLLVHDAHQEAVLKTRILHRFEDHRHFYEVKQKAFV